MIRFNVFRWPVLWVGWALLMMGHAAFAQVDPECDADGDGRVNGYSPDTWSEAQHQVFLLNFYGITMAPTPLHSPAALKPFKLVPSIELGYVPQLGCYARSVFDGTKTEHTNKTPVFPRIRLQLGLPMGFWIGLGGDPPVKLFGVQAGLIDAELGYGHVLKERIEVGARAYILGARVKGDLAGPFEGQTAEDDVYRNTVYGLDVSAGYRIPKGDKLFVPYAGLGITRVIGLMYVGETLPEDFDETDPDQATVPTAGNDEIAKHLYRGPSFELGMQAHIKKLNVSAELVLFPQDLRMYFGPRIAVGYEFF
jgi:hypothetical protein